MKKFYTFTKKIDRRSPRNSGDENSPILRENLISRDGRLKRPDGTVQAIIGFSGIVTWSARYYTVETGQVSPKTFAYTQDGILWVIDDSAGTATKVLENLNENAYPKSWLFKTQTQTKMYFVDGEKLYVYDGNNDNKFIDTEVVDRDDNSIEPIDLIEHKDRLFLISETILYVSKNLDPSVFDDATDCIDIIVGSGKGKNLALGKIEDTLFILNTEGIFRLVGDTISAVATTFEIRLVEERNIIAGRSAVKVEKAIVFVADDLELWSFDGSNSKMLSYSEKLKDFINTNREMLDRMVATYYNNYYMLSFVEKGLTYNNLEIWWDALEDKIDFVRGRNVSCYMQTDPTVENAYMQLGRSDTEKLMWADQGRNFDGVGIETKLTTRDIVMIKGHNVRFRGFYPSIEPTAQRTMFFRYLLDGRLSDLDGDANWLQDLSGEAKLLGVIRIANQAQFLDRLRPQINYAKGESIRFELFDSSLNLEFTMLGMGVSYTDKGIKKGKKVGQ